MCTMADFPLPPLRPSGKPSSTVTVHFPPVKVSARQAPAPSSTMVTALSYPIRDPSKHASYSFPGPNPICHPRLTVKKLGGKSNPLPPLSTAVKQAEATQDAFYLQVSSSELFALLSFFCFSLVSVPRITINWMTSIYICQFQRTTSRWISVAGEQWVNLKEKLLKWGQTFGSSSFILFIL